MSATQQFVQTVTGDKIVFLFIVFLAIKELVILVDWYRDKFGVETKSTIQKKEYIEMILRHEALLLKIPEQIDNLAKQIECVSQNVEMNRRDEDHRRIKELRSYIRTFGNEILHEDKSIEEIEDVFDLHEEYVALLKKYGENNGRTDRAMNNINAYYQKIISQELLENKEDAK